jgi:hypothetical protein
MASKPWADNRGGVFRQALEDGGVSSVAAGAATAAIAHCSTPRRWRGPMSLDYTHPNIRLVTPELRKFQFPNFDFHTTQGERRGPKRGGPEEETDPPPTPYQEPYNPRPDFEPAQPGDGRGDGQYAAGRYIDIRQGVISVLASRTGVAILDSDRIVGGSITVTAGEGAEKVMRVTKEGDFIDREFVIRMKEPTPMTVITDVYFEDKTLVFKQASILAWEDSRSAPDRVFQLNRHNGVTEGKLEGDALQFDGEVIYYLGEPPEPTPALFNIPVADCTS